MARGRGMDPHEKEALIDRILSYIHNAIPDPPVSVDGDLCILFDADGGGVDRLSLLPTAGTPINPSTMVPSVKILALPVRFGIRNDAKMLPNFLKCFPNLEMLHIHSQKTSESTGRLNLKFWQESGAIECIQSHIAMMAFHDFRGERSELSFLKFVVENAQKLKMLVVQFANGCVNSGPEVVAQVKSLFAGKRGATPPCSVLVLENRLSEGEFWDFERGSDYSNPFALFRCKGGNEFSI